MDLRPFDLNLLTVLDALLKDRHVTLAAGRLGMSQPAVSAALKKLRAVFDDDLFVKGARGVDPTPRALALQEPLERILSAIDEDLLHRRRFDPASSRRTFVLITGELGQMTYVRPLLCALRSAAPLANLRAVSPSALERGPMLEEGRADLAIGHFPQLLQTNFFQQLLYRRPLVCLARRGHPALRDGPPSLAAFAALDHAVVGTGSNFQALYEAELRRLGVRRRVVVELTNFGAVPGVLADSDLVTILPETLAEHYVAGGADLVTFEAPFPLPMFEVRQFWHRRANQDPAVAWLRQLMVADFQDGGGAAGRVATRF